MNTAVEIEKHMTKYPVLATPDMTKLQALKLMKTFHFRHLPVMEEDTIVGVVSQRDLLQATDSAPIGNLMTKNPYVVRAGTLLSEVTYKMASEKYGSAVVANSSGEILGIFTTTDALKMLTWYLAKEEKESELGRERLIEEWFTWDASMGE